MERNFKVGELVGDDLTNTVVKIIRVNIDTKGNIGYWVNSQWLDGARHPWELTVLETPDFINRLSCDSTPVHAEKSTKKKVKIKKVR